VKRADGSAEMVPGGYGEVVGRVAELYAERLQMTGEAPTVRAPTNSDAHRIGAAVRAERRVEGERMQSCGVDYAANATTSSPFAGQKLG
jgi:hypothetical protein